MKKSVIWILVVLLAVSFVGCGTKEKLEKKTGEAITEKIVEEASGGDVDIDGDTVKFKGEDGEEMAFGTTEWPTSQLAESIPKFKDGKVVTVMEMNDSLLIALEEVSMDDFADYLDEIKKTFSEEAYEMKSEGNISYGALNGTGLGITLNYSVDETLSITVVQEPQ